MISLGLVWAWDKEAQFRSDVVPQVSLDGLLSGAVIVLKGPVHPFLSVHTEAHFTIRMAGTFNDVCTYEFRSHVMLIPVIMRNARQESGPSNFQS
jgi:hypothetical protein